MSHTTLKVEQRHICQHAVLVKDGGYLLIRLAFHSCSDGAIHNTTVEKVWPLLAFKEDRKRGGGVMVRGLWVSMVAGGVSTDKDVALNY